MHFRAHVYGREQLKDSCHFSLGFWLKEATYREMPSVAFKHELLVILELGGTDVADGDYVTYSTFQMYNQLQAQRLRVPIIKVHVLLLFVSYVINLLKNLAFKLIFEY